MTNYIVDLFHRAQNNKKLTAQERAMLKAIQGAIIGFIISAGPQLIEVLVGHAVFNLTPIAVETLLGAFVLALLKLWYAQGDQQLGDILDAYSKAMEKQALDQMIQPNSDGSANIPALQFIVPMTRAVAATSQATTQAAQHISEVSTAKTAAVVLPTPPQGGSVIAPVNSAPMTSPVVTTANVIPATLPPDYIIPSNVGLNAAITQPGIAPQQ